MSDPAGPAPTDGDLGPYIPGAPDAAPPRRRRGATVAAAIGAAVAMVAGVLALATLTSGGGSATPEDAVRKLANAMASEDVLGALEALVPAERAVLRNRLVDVVGELGRLGVLDDSFDLGDVPGADVTVEGLELRSEALSDDVASVLVTGGRAGLSLAMKDLPLGPLVRRATDGPGVATPQPAGAELGKGDDMRVVAVREDGDWFVSLGYTVADAVRRAGGAPTPDFTRALVPRGEATPEATVRELARAAAAFDAERLLELTAPGEASPLHAYAPLFLADLRAWADGVRRDGSSAQVESIEVTSAVDGDEAHVTVDQLSLGITTPAGPGRFTYDGACARYDGGEQEGTFEVCKDDPQLGTLRTAPFAAMTLTVVRRGGSWFLSPVGTYVDAVLATLRSLDRDEVERALTQGGVGAVAPLLSPLAGVLWGGAFAPYPQGSSVESTTGCAVMAPELPAGMTPAPESVPVPCEELRQPTSVATYAPPMSAPTVTAGAAPGPRPAGPRPVPATGSAGTATSSLPAPVTTTP